MKTKLLKSMRALLVAVLLGVGGSAWAQITTWTFKDNTAVWGAFGITLNGGNQYDKDANAVTSGGVTFTGTSGFVSTAKGIGFNATGSTSDENISIVVPAGYKASVSILTSDNRTVIGSFGGNTQTFNASWASSTKEFNNAEGTDDIILYLYCNQNAGGSDQSKAPFLEVISLTDMTSVASHSWTAYAVATINDVKTTIKTYSSESDVAEGTNYTVAVDKVIIKDGVYYELNDAAFATNVFSKTYTMGNSAPVHEITYTKVENAVFFGEIEDIYTGGSNASTSEDIVLSNGKGYKAMSSNGGYVKVKFSVPSNGVYNLALGMNNTNSTNRGFNYSIDNATNSETFTVTKYSAYVQNINQYLTEGEHTLQMNITYSLTPVFDYLLITKNVEVENAIAECKTYETSSDFATHIDGLFNAGSLTTTAQVYSAHTAWQIAQADASSSLDYTKVIFNADFGTGSLAPWTIYGDAATGDAISDNDANGVIESNGAGGYQYYTGWNGRNVSQSILGLPAGVYRLSAQIYSWKGGAPVRLFANGSLSASENGESHIINLDFVVTGSEESVKIGVGGIGNDDDTDNTWGTWGYRINYFTLTKIASVSSTLGTNGYGTFASPYALDLANLPAGLTAYKAAVSGTTVTFTPVTEAVQANTGLLLKGDASETYSIPVTTSGADISETNAFLVNEGGTTFDGDANYYYFGLIKNTLTFGQFAPGTVAIPADKAYLKVLKTSIDESPSRALTIKFGDEETGIRTIDNGQLTIDNAVYNLKGQRVEKPVKGLYIVRSAEGRLQGKNGKKVIIK